MVVQQAILTFTEGERQLGERLLKQAAEIDRIEGYTEPHAVAIARMAEILGAGMGLHGSDLTALKFAGLAHDIGYRAMKRNYLLRLDGLTWEERLDLWRHTILGGQAAAEMRLSRQTQLLIRWHHEAWNGQGYPDGLSGEAIPVGARILHVVDAYYALISRRPHRPPYDPLDAEQIVADLAGIEFDPRIVKQLLLALAEERKEREAAAWPGTLGPPFDVQAPFAIYEPGAEILAEAAAEPAAAPEEPAADAPPAEEALPDLLDVSPAPEEETYFVPDTQEMDLPLTPPPPAAPAAPASREEEEPPAAAAPAPLPEEPTKSETD